MHLHPLIGNAWAAAGMLRVLATIMRSLWVEEMQKEIKDLHEWSQEIVAAAATRAVSCKDFPGKKRVDINAHKDSIWYDPKLRGRAGFL